VQKDFCAALNKRTPEAKMNQIRTIREAELLTDAQVYDTDKFFEVLNRLRSDLPKKATRKQIEQMEDKALAKSREYYAGPEFAKMCEGLAAKSPAARSK
jgi:hypothetical protein